MARLRMAAPLILAGLLAAPAGCKQKAPDDTPARTVQRTEYAPEEFGIGRRHTGDAGCNREIDRLLDEVRLCYKNSGSAAQCESIQQQNSDKIKRLKNSVRCAR
jgi:hypothetical protein